MKRRMIKRMRKKTQVIRIRKMLVRARTKVNQLINDTVHTRTVEIVLNHIYIVIIPIAKRMNHKQLQLVFFPWVWKRLSTTLLPPQLFLFFCSDILTPNFFSMLILPLFYKLNKHNFPAVNPDAGCTWGSHRELAIPRSLQHLISAFDLADSHAFPYCKLFRL